MGTREEGDETQDSLEDGCVDGLQVIHDCPRPESEDRLDLTDPWGVKKDDGPGPCGPGLNWDASPAEIHLARRRRK